MQSASPRRPEEVRSRVLHPFRALVALLGGALVILVAVVSSVATGHAPDPHVARMFVAARADTDSVAVDRPLLDGLRPEPEDTTATDTTAAARADSIRTDSLTAADSLALPDTGLVPRYFRTGMRDRWAASPLQRQTRPFLPKLGSYWRHQILLDSTEQVYIARELVGDNDVRIPYRMDLDTYRRIRLSEDMEKAWYQLAEQRAQQRTNRSRGGLGFNFVVPGGQQSAFTTIFGKPEVDLRVNGQADIRAGFDYRKSDLQANITGNPSQLDPDFKQDLRLGITGRIGDKLSVDVNWDTNNQFDYQNQLKLVYRGYEDEIIQNIEAGNVFLNTPSRLIRGGQSLFGIKSEMKMGGLRLTTVASQQEGQANSLSLEGGSETTRFDLKPTHYQDRQHFFLSFYFRNRWEDALRDPNRIEVAHGFERITEIEVWKLTTLSGEDPNTRQVVAMVDLGERRELLANARAYEEQILPNPLVLDQYDESAGDIETLRNGNSNVQQFLEGTKGLGPKDWATGRFRRLERNEYQFDDILGYISLQSALSENEALAVAYRYVAGGRTITVGDFSTETGGSTGAQDEDRLVLKLIRPVQLPQPGDEPGAAAWYLEMRNIYPLQGSGLSPTDFELQVYYEPPGKTGSKTVAAIDANRTLLQVLGLDRVNADGSPNPDDRFDYRVNVTINPAKGLLIFPYLEPFGSHLARLIESPEDRNLYVFDRLYREKKANADRDTQHDVYRIRGSYTGGTKASYDLRAYAGLVEGSVNVTSGGSRLTEGIDYVVDYQGGTVTITNQAYLASGRDINITYEQNSFFNLQKKTLLGARADYDFGDQLDLGATFMRLSQKSPIDKYRIGEEPISNTIWGVDGTINLQPRWLTRAIDRLPLLQTKAPSSIQITGEFAQLRPGASETIAFEQTRRKLQDVGLDFHGDELSGISYIDDFEGFETTFSLKQPGAWRLASPPDSIPAYPIPIPAGDSLRTTRRATLGWYQLSANMIQNLCARTPGCSGGNLAQQYPQVAPVFIKDVYPTKDTQGEVDQTLQTFDLYYNPRSRGPYNYTTDLQDFLDRPADNWAGIMQRLPEGYNDFSTKNIEFLEFIIQPFADNPQNDAGRNAKLIIDVGSISEDVIPDGKLNTEDGLSTSSFNETDVGNWARTPRVAINNMVDVDDANGTTEDLGLDGLVSYDLSRYPPIVHEQVKFRGFLEALRAKATNDPRYQAELAKAENDPSGDDYHYFEDSYFDRPEFFPEGASMLERLTRWFPSTELNSYEGQNKLAPASYTSIKRGNSRTPDTEDLNLNSAVDVTNSYFQYEVPLSVAALDSLSAPERVNDFVVGKIPHADPRRSWYLVRIPFNHKDKRVVGSIRDFTSIESIRIWTTGHEVPFTLRFATLELVGSQWQKSEQIALERETASDTVATETRFIVESINNEENLGYRTPNGTIISQTRLSSGQTQMAREQAMVLRVENLMPGKQRAIFRTQSQGLDLSRYSNLRMFAHMHGALANGEQLINLPPELARQKVRLFVRLGANETNDYYEYELPLSPSDPTIADPERLWMTNQDVGGRRIDLNSVNLVLDALNQLKVARDQDPSAALDTVYWSDREHVALSPSVEEFAPPGTRIGVKGNPSINRLNTIVIGIRNAADSLVAGVPNRRPEDILETVEVWVNELRVSGYDEKVSSAAIANADIKLADVAGIKASFQWQQDGFGSLSSTLAEREQNDLLNWGVTTDLRVDKFIPERFGWSIPVSFQIQRNTSTPRFSPQRGDIRLKALLDQIDEDDTLTPEQREARKQEILDAAQSRSLTRSFTARLQKSGSRSSFLRHTIDGLSLSYSWSDNASRSPTQQLNDQWRWSTQLGYRLSIRRPHTFKPFGFLGDIPVLGVLGDLQFNYLPQNVSFTASASRSFSEAQERPRQLSQDLELDRPYLAQYPIRPQHALAHRRNFSLQYNPFTFLNLTYDTDTNQSLNALGVDTLYTVVTMDTLGNERAFDNVLVGDTTAYWYEGMASAYQIKRLDVKSSQEVINRIFAGHPGLRTEDHQQRFSSTFRPNFGTRLNWINLQDIIYSVNFGWRNGPVTNNLGADVSNQIELRGGITLRPQEFWRKFGFYKKLEEAQRQAAAQAATRAREQEQERQRRRQERERLREEARKRKEAGEAAPDEQAPDELLRPPEKKPPEAPPADSLAAQEEKSGFKLPLPNMKALIRQTILAVTGIRDFSITYNGTFSSNSTNVGIPWGANDTEVNYSLFDAFRGRGPSLGYRFGFERRVDAWQRVITPSVRVTDALRDAHRLQARTTLAPTQAFQINLTWNTDWTEDESFTYSRNEFDLNKIDTTITASGNNRASVWAFGASYMQLFERQRATLEADIANAGTGDGPIGDANRDGRVVLTGNSVIDDFQRSFLRGLATFDTRGLLPVPLPGWQVSYSGLNKWPVLNRLVQSATLRHGYSADYSTDFRQNPLSAEATRTFDLGRRKIEYPVPTFEVGGIRVNERYQPLIGLDLTWKGRLQTNIAWNRSNAYTLSTSTFEIGENKTSEITFSGSFQQQGLSLPFIKNRLNNRISFTLTLARATLSDKRYYLRNALVGSDTEGPNFDVSRILTDDQYVKALSASTRLTVTPQIAYQFSNRVSANFSLRYENFISKDSRTPSSTNINGGFNIRVSIAN